jgi:hypothetical protein
MLDRIELLSELNSLALKLTGTNQRALEKTLDKAVGQMLLGLTLPIARAATPAVRRTIVEGLNEALDAAALGKVSKLWEPKRDVPKGIAHAELVADLAALMEGQREPFEPTRLGLAQARSLGEQDKAALQVDIQRFASLKHLKPILKKWDKASPLNTAGDEKAIRVALIILLQG